VYRIAAPVIVSFLSLACTDRNPKTLDDCLADVARSARTDAAVGVGASACVSKFGQADHKKGNNYVDGACVYLWSGYEFLPSAMKPPTHEQYEISWPDGARMRFSFERGLIERNREALKDQVKKQPTDAEVVYSLVAPHRDTLIQQCKVVSRLAAKVR
jgi:hypothetical protein